MVLPASANGYRDFGLQRLCLIGEHSPKDEGLNNDRQKAIQHEGEMNARKTYHRPRGEVAQRQAASHGQHEKTCRLAPVLIICLRLQECVGGRIGDGEKKAAADKQKRKLPNGSDPRHSHNEQTVEQGRGQGHFHGVETLHRQENQQRPQHASDAKSRQDASELPDVGMQHVFHDHRAKRDQRTAKEARAKNGEQCPAGLLAF